MANWLLYGAYGYTGRLIAERAKRLGMSPILAGRSRAQLAPMAKEFGWDMRVFPLYDGKAVDEGLRDVNAVMNAAGPFSQTANPLVQGCLRNKVHYLDITGEIKVFEAIFAADQQAKAAGITLLPGTGFDVVPTDCVAARLKSELPDADRLELAFAARGQFSHGTLKTMIEELPEGGAIRSGGELVKVPAGHSHREVDFSFAKLDAISIPWGDVATAYWSTGIPNITVFLGNATVNGLAGNIYRVGDYVFHGFQKPWSETDSTLSPWLRDAANNAVDRQDMISGDGVPAGQVANFSANVGVQAGAAAATGGTSMFGTGTTASVVRGSGIVLEGFDTIANGMNTVEAYQSGDVTGTLANGAFTGLGTTGIYGAARPAGRNLGYDVAVDGHKGSQVLDMVADRPIIGVGPPPSIAKMPPDTPIDITVIGSKKTGFSHDDIANQLLKYEGQELVDAFGKKITPHPTIKHAATPEMVLEKFNQHAVTTYRGTNQGDRLTPMVSDVRHVIADPDISARLASLPPGHELNIISKLPKRRPIIEYVGGKFHDVGDAEYVEISWLRVKTKPEDLAITHIQPLPKTTLDSKLNTYKKHQNPIIYQNPNTIRIERRANAQK